MPYVSVIVTACNVEKYIGRCLRSILDQSLARSEYEIIVVNDASEDRTPFAAEVFGEDIRLISNETRLGLPKSLNKAIRAARGKFVVRLDGDDYVNRDFLKILALHLELNPSVDAFACDYLTVTDQEEVLTTQSCIEKPIACGIMFRIDHLLDIGLYDEDFHLLEDEDLRLRFLKQRRIERVQLPLYRYRRHKNNITNDLEGIQRYKGMLQAKHSLEVQ